MALLTSEVYWDYVMMENGSKNLYVCLKSILYSLLCSALLFYCKLWGNLVN